MKRLHLVAAAAALLLAGVVEAQTAGTITLTATQTGTASPVSATLAWSTSPVATSCSAPWTTKTTASGTQALSGITATTQYSITCSWPGALGTATVSWVNPTTNTDGSSLVDLTRIRVLYGTSASTLNQSINAPTITATSLDVPGLAAGTWYFAARASNSKGLESDNSNVASKAIAGGSPVTASKSVTVTVDTVPNPPTNLTVVEKIAYYVRPDLQRFAFLRGNRYGHVSLGAACDESRQTIDGYTAISRPSRVVSPRPPSGTVLVARCG